MKASWVIPVIASVLVLGVIGFSQEAQATNTVTEGTGGTGGTGAVWFGRLTGLNPGALIDTVGVKTGAGPHSANARVAVYDDVGGVPQNLLGESVSTAVIQTANTWTDIALTTSVRVPENGILWLAGQHDTNQMNFDLNTLGRRNLQAFGAFPNPAGSTGNEPQIALRFTPTPPTTLSKSLSETVFITDTVDIQTIPSPTPPTTLSKSLSETVFITDTVDIQTIPSPTPPTTPTEKFLVVKGLATNPNNDPISYKVVVTGSITKGPAANPADKISPDGKTLNGFLKPQTGTDNYFVTGDVVSVEAPVNLAVTLDGVPIPVITVIPPTPDRCAFLESALDLAGITDPLRAQIIAAPGCPPKNI